MKNYKLFLLLPLLLLVLMPACNKESKEDNPDPVKNDDPDTLSYSLDNFPNGSKPEEIGAKLAERFLMTSHSFWGNISSGKTADHITYPDVCAWLGALWFVQRTGNDELYGKLAGRFDLLFTTEKNLQPSLSPSAGNKVDYYVFGALPLEIFKRKQEDKYKELGMKYADGQWLLPANATQSQKDW
ncbi:MAG TPA: hypothetical protein VHO90_09700, partial [Bacteroidales bacterium]|nr:hypothetical protein [Bacteroidales bacterium]